MLWTAIDITGHHWTAPWKYDIEIRTLSTEQVAHAISDRLMHFSPLKYIADGTLHDSYKPGISAMFITETIQC